MERACKASPSYWLIIELMKAMLEPTDVSRPPKSVSPHLVKFARSDSKGAAVAPMRKSWAAEAPGTMIGPASKLRIELARYHTTLPRPSCARLLHVAQGHAI